MTLLFCDGFDHYTTMSQKWSNPGQWSIGAYGRFGTNGARLYSFGHAYSPPFANSTVLIAGVAYMPQINSNDGNERHIICFRDLSSVQVAIMLTPTYRIGAYRGSTLLGSGTTYLRSDLKTWHYIEAKVLIDNTNGGVWVRVNGVDEVRLGAYAVSPTSLDTQSTANAYANCFSVNGYQYEQIDDLYICNDSGSMNNDFLGDVRVQSIFPTADGNSTQWTPSTGTSHYALIDETAPNGDTDYVSETTAGEKDTYAFGNLTSTSGTIKGVQVLINARKDDAGSRSIAPVYRPVSTDYDGTTVSVSDSYAYLREITEVSPETSVAWTIAEINGAEFGVTLKA